MNLSVNKLTCTKCSKCVNICPSIIFKQDNTDNDIELQNTHRCIICGHCVAVCPTGAVIHSHFPENKVHKINRELLPSPEQVMLLCKSRRSNRAFSKKQIPIELLNQILEAAHRAPTASNMQQVEFTLVTDPAKLKEIIDASVGVFASLYNLLRIIKPILKIFAPNIYGLIPLFRKLKNDRKKGKDPILRDATALILIHTPQHSRFGIEDSNLAYQNASLMAESLGVNQFYTGYLCITAKQKKNKIEKLLGINGKIHAGMALALPKFKFPNYVDKRELKVNKFLIDTDYFDL